MPRIKPNHSTLLLTLAAILAANPHFSRAATITKADNLLPLNDPASWVGNILPTSNDIALFDNTLQNFFQFTLGSDLTWHGIQLTNPATNTAILADGHVLTLGNGGIDLSTATVNMTLNNNLIFNSESVSSEIWNVATTLTINSNLFVSYSASYPSTEGTFALVKSGPGTLLLGGTNWFAVSLTFDDGTVKLAHQGSFDFMRFAPQMDPFGARLMFSSGAGTLDLAGFDAFIGELSGPGKVTNSVAGPVTLTIAPVVGSAGGNLSFTGTIFDGAGTVSLVKTDVVSQSFKSPQAYTGSTTIVRGVLSLSYTTTSDNIILPQSMLVLAGGSLRLGSNASQLQSQTFNGLIVMPGRSAIAVHTGLPFTLNLAAIERHSGGVVFFNPIESATANIMTTALNNASGMLGGWAVYYTPDPANAQNWAAVDAQGKIIPVTSFANSSSGTSSFAPTVNTLLTGNLDLASAPPDLHSGSLRFDKSGTLVLHGNNVIDSGGILINSTVGFAAISGGDSITSGNGQDLVVNQFASEVINVSTTQPRFTIASPIVDADGGATPIALTLSGTGNGTGGLVLAAPNSYSGGTFINSGLLRVQPGATLGSGKIRITRGADSLQIGPGLVLTSSSLVPNDFELNDQSIPGNESSIIDVLAGISATLSGNIIADGGPSTQFRIGTSGGTLVLTGSSVSGSPTPNAKEFTTILWGTGAGGHMLIASHGSLTSFQTPICLANMDLVLQEDTRVQVVGLSSGLGFSLGVGVNFGNGIQNTLTIRDNAILDIGSLSFSLNHTTGRNTVNFDGGSIVLGQFVLDNPIYTATMNYNGTTLMAGQDSTVFLPNFKNVLNFAKAGGAKFNTNGHNITLSQPLLHDPALSSTADGGLTKSGAGILTLSSSAHTFSGPLSIQQDTVSLTYPGALKLNAVVLAHTNTGSSAVYASTLQLNSSRLILQSTDPSDKANKVLALNEALFSGHGTANTWTGTTGITSATVAADPSHLTIGVYDNAALKSLSNSSLPRTDWAGGTGNVDTLSLLVTPALKGDANLDGLVDIADMIVIANNWNLAGLSNGISTIDMAHGDVNADGIVDIGDMVVIANNWNQTSSFSLSPEIAQSMGVSWGDLPVTVPEPNSLAILLAAPLLLRRRPTHAPLWSGLG